MVFLQVICYNCAQFEGKVLHQHTVKDCQSVQQSVLAETTLPKPLLNYALRALDLTRVLMVRWEISFAICNSAKKNKKIGATLKTVSPVQSVYVRRCVLLTIINH